MACAIWIQHHFITISVLIFYLKKIDFVKETVLLGQQQFISYPNNQVFICIVVVECVCVYVGLYSSACYLLHLHKHTIDNILQHFEHHSFTYLFIHSFSRSVIYSIIHSLYSKTRRVESYLVNLTWINLDSVWGYKWIICAYKCMSM